MEPEQEEYSVSITGAEIGAMEIGSAGASVEMPGAEIGTAEIGSMGATVDMAGAEIGTAVFASQAPVNIQHHHYYGRDGKEEISEQTESSVRTKERTDPPPTGYTQLTEDVFMSRNPLRRGVKVFRAFQQHANGHRRPLAVKVIHGCEEEILREVRYLLTLASHPNIVQIIHSVKYDGPTGCDLYIIMELCGDKDLLDYIEEKRLANIPLDFKKTITFSRQILNGVKHIHRFKIIHRDLKPENILLLPDEENLKVTDFGISKELRDGRSVTKQTSQLGTDGFRAPETFADGEISQKADVFSLGIILYLLWSNGKHAFGDNVHLRNNNIIEHVGLDLSGLEIFGRKKHELLDLVRRMLKADPRSRPTIEEVLDHPFFGNEGEDPGNSGASDVAAIDHRSGEQRPLASAGTGIGVVDAKSKTIQTFKSNENTWSVLQVITNEIHAKGYLYTAVVNKEIFVLARSCACFKFDLSKPADGWIRLPQRSVDGIVQLVPCNGQLYAFHNYNESVIVEILDRDHTFWRQIRKPKPRWYEAVTVAKDNIFIFGGWDGKVLRQSTKFDPSNESWLDLQDMLTQRYDAAATAVDDKIYVIGGHSENALKTTECFDISTQLWTTLMPMNNSHTYFNAFAFDGHIYAVGSYRPPFIIEEYDPETDTWKNVISVTDKDIFSRATFVLRN